MRGIVHKGSANKYGNKKVTVDGETYDSRLEFALFNQLSFRRKSGEISDIEHHPKTIFLSEARIQFRVDFRFKEKNGNTAYAETKGAYLGKGFGAGKIRRFTDPKWSIKKKLWRAYGPGVLYVYSGTATNLVLLETIIPEEDNEDS